MGVEEAGPNRFPKSLSVVEHNMPNFEEIRNYLKESKAGERRKAKAWSEDQAL